MMIKNKSVVVFPSCNHGSGDISNLDNALQNGWIVKIATPVFDDNTTTRIIYILEKEVDNNEN